MDDKTQDIILDLLTEVRTDQKKDSERIQKTESCVTNIQNELSEVKKETKVNTKHMGEHIARTEIAEQGLEILKDLHQDNQRRIELLEIDGKKKDQAYSELVQLVTVITSEKRATEKIKTNFKDNINYWLTIATLAAGLITKIMGLW